MVGLRLLVLAARVVPRASAASPAPRALGRRHDRRRGAGCRSASRPFWGRPRPGATRAARRTSAAPRPRSRRSAGSAPSRRSRSAGPAASVPVRSAGSPPSPGCRTRASRSGPSTTRRHRRSRSRSGPRTLHRTGREVRSAGARRAPRCAPARARRRWRDAAVGSEDAFDAAVSALVMSRHEAELRALPALDDLAARARRVRVVARGQSADCVRCRRLTDFTIAGCNMAEMSVSDVHE